jgi:hypothetical protein
MTSYALSLTVGLGTVCLLICVLSTVYVWSDDAGRRNRAWRVLQALLQAVGRGHADDA